MPKTTRSLWLARLAIAVVMAWNLECAVAFVAQPGRYAPGFEVAGVPGEALVRGMGVLFVMWNVPYAVALWHPRRQRTSLIEALAMQGIGLVGETLLLATLPAGYARLRGSTLRFILFDAAGLLLLAGAVWLTRGQASATRRPQV